MILKASDTPFLWNGVLYAVGGHVLVTGPSIYQGLYGEILEIHANWRKRDDKDAVQMICTLTPPSLPSELLALAKNGSLYGDTPLKPEDITWERVSMTPDMITPLPQSEGEYLSWTFYAVRSHWSLRGQDGSSEHLFTDGSLAQKHLRDELVSEWSGGIISELRKNPRFIEEESSHSYACFLEGEYCENHYEISLETQTAALSPEFIHTVGGLHRAARIKEDFLSQVCDWEEYNDLTEEQKEQLLRHPCIPAQILRWLDQSSSYQEAYWEAVSEAAHQILQEYQRQLNSEKAAGPFPTQ